MNTINCSCGCNKPCGCGNACKFNPCAVTCPAVFTREYGYVYNVLEQEVEEGEAVTFSANGLLSSGVSHVAGSDKISFDVAGVYLVEFYVKSGRCEEYTLYQNGAPVTGSTYSSGSGNITTGSVIISVQRGDAITLVNTDNNDDNIDGDGETVNAAVTVQRLF